jgi:hypothetical protein
MGEAMKEDDEAKPSEEVNDVPEMIEDSEEDPPASISEWLNTENATICAGIILFFALFILLSAHPMRFQIATLSAYTLVILGLIFRGPKYSLRIAAVRKALPNVFLLHGLFLVFLYVVITYEIKLMPDMPAFLLHPGRRHPSLYATGSGLIVLAAMFIQVAITSCILDRNLKDRIE